ncbi:MAG: hypothetical protein Q4B77_02575 [Coriobacteriaceae bacterium]|nr:hypothetical protein [Coriobacteriaceae bacterium]
MGLRTWIKNRAASARVRKVSEPHRESAQPQAAPAPSTQPAAPDSSVWEPVPAYVPVDPHEHTHACVIASAIAAGDHPTSELRVKRVLIANPEHRLVSVIATALAAGALEKSSFTVKNIYKMKEEGSHAA